MNPSSNQPQQLPGAMPPAGVPYAAPNPQQQPASPYTPAAPLPPQQPTQGYAPPAIPQGPAPGAPAPYQQAYASPPAPGVAPVAAAPSTPILPSAAKPEAAKQPHANPNSTQNMLQIAEIRDGIVIMNDGSYRSVIMVKSINFDLMSSQEQEAVEYNYQGFLNSLYFPIQVFIRSQKVDLTPYIEKLDKIRAEHDNMLLALLMEDYIGYMSSLAEQTNIMDKKFYIVIPFFPHQTAEKAGSSGQNKNFIAGLSHLFSPKTQHVIINEEELEKAKNELRNRVQAVLGGLLQCNIQGLPLDTQELIELYYDTYNPDTATRQQLKNFNDLTADYITKGEGMATQPHLDKELA